jgi:ABC-type nickel/cobalt efflux system permease component RcnA
MDANSAPGLLLVLSVLVVGVLHTVVPDHWAPIALIARQRGWSRAETARAAFQAGVGHAGTTLLIGLVVWFAGVGFASRFGRLVDTAASAALVAFGAWIAFSAWRELHGHGHEHGGFVGHGHAHRHEGGLADGSWIHGAELRRIDTPRGLAALSIFAAGVAPRFRFSGPAVDWVRAETRREDGARQTFAFVDRGRFWESIEEIPEPHRFMVSLVVGHGLDDERYDVEFVEHAREPHVHGDGHAESDPADDPLYLPLGGGTAVLIRHAHAHRHGGSVHVHWHDHAPDTAHEIALGADAAPPVHVHKHKTSARTALLLILGSSPMVEGIPVFFAASRYGIGLILVMAIVFASSTIATYVALCVLSTAGLQRVHLGPVERYGEVISGAFIALVGVVFWAWPVI